MRGRPAEVDLCRRRPAERLMRAEVRVVDEARPPAIPIAPLQRAAIPIAPLQRMPFRSKSYSGSDFHTTTRRLSRMASGLQLLESPERKVKHVLSHLAGAVFPAGDQPQRALALLRAEGVEQIPVGLKDHRVIGAVFDVAGFLEGAQVRHPAVAAFCAAG